MTAILKVIRCSTRSQCLSRNSDVTIKHSDARDEPDSSILYGLQMVEIVTMFTGLPRY